MGRVFKMFVTTIKNNVTVCIKERFAYVLQHKITHNLIIKS